MVFLLVKATNAMAVSSLPVRRVDLSELALVAGSIELGSAHGAPEILGAEERRRRRHRGEGGWALEGAGAMRAAVPERMCRRWRRGESAAAGWSRVEYRAVFFFIKHTCITS